VQSGKKGHRPKRTPKTVAEQGEGFFGSGSVRLSIHRKDELQTLYEISHGFFISI
jgi:hypothetical protein